MTKNDTGMNKEKTTVRTVRAVERAMAMLNAFENGDSLQLRDIAEKAGLDRGTTRRLLLTLMSSGAIVQHEEGGRYSLGPMIRRLASRTVAVDLRDIMARPLQDLAAEVGLTVFLAEYRNHGALCLERYHDPHGMEVHFWPVGGNLPINCGAAPKLLLAYQSESDIDIALQTDFEEITPNTITDPEEIRAHLAKIREQGWELAVDDVIVGITALAVPVFDHSGELLAAISIAGFTQKMLDNGQPAYLDRLTKLIDEVRPMLP